MNVAAIDERQETKALSEKLAHRLRMAIQDEWRATGYDPRAHLRGATFDGNDDVLRDFYHCERTKIARGGFAGWLACQEMYEIAALRIGRGG